MPSKEKQAFPALLEEQELLLAAAKLRLPLL
jgi:hypothetical protein